MNKIFEQIWERKISFLVTFFCVFTISYVILVAIDFLPETPIEIESEEDLTTEVELSIENDEEVIDAESTIDTDVSTVENEVLISSSELIKPFVSQVPVSIFFKKLNKTADVLNPESRAISDLDTALLDGVVRHPDSAVLGQEGNVFIIGHSSYLPAVFNKNFQAFNGIQNLEWGDIIEVYSIDSVYEYRVEKVYHAVAQDLTIPISGTEKILTLATCNSFGGVDDRYIVEAKQISVKIL